jgi:hypothetical protein
VETITFMAAGFLGDRTKWRIVSTKMDTAGYPPVRNPYTTDGRWKVGGQNAVVYCPKDLGTTESHHRVEALIKEVR